MRQIGGAFRKAWFSDAQQDYRSARNSPSSVTPPARCSVQKQKAWFLLLQVFIRNRAHSPLFLRAESFRQQGSRKSQDFARDFWEEEERSAHASIALLGQCKNAADRDDEGALAKSVILPRAIKLLYP